VPRSASEIDGLVGLLSDCHDDPDLFNTAILEREPYWTNPGSGHPDQLEWVQACAESSVVVVETGNALGKDYALGGLVPWWCLTRLDSVAIVTGPSQTLLGSVTWKELRRAMDPERASSPDRPSMLKMFPEIFGADLGSGVKASPLAMRLDKNGWGALAYSTTSIERASGQHAANLAVFVTEASGITDEIGEALDSLKASLMVLCYNPIRGEGWAVDYARQGEADARDGVPRSHAVRYFNMPSTCSPHADLDKSPFGLADKTWLEAMYRRRGADSPWTRSHIKAIRPKLDNEALIRPELLGRATGEMAVRAAAEWRRAGKGGPRRIACDVGEGVGNARSVVGVRDDVGFLEIAADAFDSPSATADRIVDLKAKWRVADERISYDAAGNTGNRLKAALAAKKLYGVQPYYGGKPFRRNFLNLRSACAAMLARRLDPDDFRDGTRNDMPFHLPNGPHLPQIVEELSELKGRTDNDKFRLEDKADFMDRLGRSPDFADMITQSFREEAVAG